MRIFSGIQPTGTKHLGNYSGGFRQYAATQEEGDGFFCIVDLHSITVDYDPENLRHVDARPRRDALRHRASTPTARRSSPRATSPRTPRRPGCSRP